MHNADQVGSGVFLEKAIAVTPPVSGEGRP
jgi:hypothetical protein